MTRRLRPTLVVVHRYVGLVLTLFLVIAGLTGSLLAFQDEIERAIAPELFTTADTGPALPAGQLAAMVQSAYPQARVDHLPLARQPGRSVMVALSPRTDAVTGRDLPLPVDEVFVNPVTGAILGDRLWGAARLDAAHVMPFLYKLHYSLFLPGTVGYWLMGLVGLVWTLDCIVGFLLSVPRGKPFRTALGIRLGCGGYRLNFDLHRAGGLWLWPVLFVLAFSGFALNLHGQMFVPMLSIVSPVTGFDGDHGPPLRERLPEPLEAPPIGWDRAIAIAEAEAPRHFTGLHPIQDIDYRPDRGLYRAGFLSDADIDREYGRSRLWIDARTGAVVFVDDPRGTTAGDLIDAWMFPLHAGTFAGIWGRALVALAGVVTVVLAITGLVIWARKRSARRQRRGAPSGLRHGAIPVMPRTRGQPVAPAE